MSYFYAFLSGIFAFLSPCIVTLAPLFALFFFNSSLKKLQKLFLVIGTVIGFGITFSALSFGILFLSKQFKEWGDYISTIGGFVLVMIGLFGILGKKVNFGFNTNLPATFTAGTTTIGSFINGFLFGILAGSFWTPCQGPFAASIGLLMQQGDSQKSQAHLLAFFYLLGLLLPLVFLAIITHRNEKALNKPIWKKLHLASNYFLVIMGILFMFNLFPHINDFLTEYINKSGVGKFFQNFQSWSDKFADKIEFHFDIKALFGRQ